MKKTSFITVIGLVVVAVCVLSYIGFDKYNATSALAQNTAAVKTSEAEAVKMLRKSLEQSSNENQSNYSQALYLCAVSELTKNPESISNGWSILQDHLEKQPDESLDQFESKLEQISDFQRATLEALLSSTSQGSFDKVWKLNQESIIPFRNLVILSKLNPVVDLLKEIRKNPSELLKASEDNVLLDKTTEDKTTDNTAVNVIVNLEDILTAIADIPDKSNDLLAKINESEGYCKDIARELYKTLKGKYDQLDESLTFEKGKDMSESGNDSFEPTLLDEAKNKWEDGPYYTLSQKVQKLQDIVRNPVVISLLSRLDNNIEVSAESDNSARDKKYINIPVALEDMQEKIRQLIQIRYNLYANSLICECQEMTIDNPARIDVLEVLTQLDTGLLFPIVNSQVSSIIDDSLRPEAKLPPDVRDDFISKTILDEDKIPLTAF